MRHWLPFRFTPASWGLVGDAYLEADAHYSLCGEALDRRLLEIRLANDPLQLRKAMLELELCYNHITPYEAAKQRVDLAHPPGLERDLALLTVDHEHGIIDSNVYGKRCAELKDEPWVAIVNSGFNPEQGIDGVFFEFDWNAKWIDYLRTHGYVGHSEEQVLDDWFSDVCRSQNLSDQPFVARES